MTSPLELRGAGKLVDTAWRCGGVTVAITAGDVLSVVGPPGRRWDGELALAAGVTLRAELPATGATAPVVGDLVTILIAADDIAVLHG